MKILASELSTRHASIALVENGTVLGEETWDEPRAYYETFFQRVTQLLGRTGAKLQDVDVYAVGRGPGSFSGVRVALTAARAFALPHGKTVFPVSSGEALAFEMLKTRKDSNVAIVGDARRGMIWFGSFCVGPGEAPTCITPWKLVGGADIEQQLAGVDRAASSEWDRLPWTAGNRTNREHVSAFPTARNVAELVEARLAAGVSADLPEPLYLHPPV